MRANEIARKGANWWHMPWLVHELLEKKKGVDRVVRRKWMRKKAAKRIHAGRNGKKWCTQERSSAIFCLDKGTATTCSKTQHLPGTQFLWLHTFTIPISAVISLQVGKRHGREALYCSRLPVHLRKKHHTDISKITFKVYNKHDYNLPLRRLLTSPPTWRTYVPFEMKFFW